MNLTRNVVGIERLPASGLTGLRRVDAGSVALPEGLAWQSISIKVPARLTISEKVEDRVRMYTAQLVFRTCEEPWDRGRNVYLCRLADGSRRLIGNGRRPYPVATRTENHPDNMADSQLAEVTVSYTSDSEIPFVH
jgi:hypothetical protein